MPEKARGTSDLTGVRVAVTRPRHQCKKILRLLEAKNAYARCLPVLEIVPPADPGDAMEALAERNDFDIMIFVSVNAVTMALGLLGENGALSTGATIGAVGPATGRALAAAGAAAAIQPRGEVSAEGLLENPALAPNQVAGKRILLVKGEGGRPVIAQTLAARGAEVRSVDVYRRACPAGRIRDLLEEPLESFGFVIFTSGAAVENLLLLADPEEADHVRNARLVVASARLADLVRRHGAVVEPIIAPAPTDESIVEALVTWRAASAAPEATEKCSQ